VRRPLAALAAAAALLTLVPAAPASPGQRVELVVELTGQPVAGRVPARLLRGPDGHFSTHAFATRLALAEVDRQQAAVERRLRRAVPGLQVERRLQVVLNALVVQVAPSSQSRLARVPGVRRIYQSTAYAASTDRVPAVVDAIPLWGTPPGQPGGSQGDGMRIGIIDDGIDMARPSFSGTGYSYPPGFPKGIPGATNGKIIVARAFPPPGLSTPEQRTAFDPDGSEHGTHVSGIAAGNANITGITAGNVRVPGLSGVAPRAYLGNYRVLTVDTPRFGLDGNGAEIAEAVDQAVKDGMDVLNISLGEPEVDASRDPVIPAIRGAARAGVVTTVSAGNDGDDGGDGTIDSPATAPEAISVAATTNDRFFGVPVKVLGPGAVPPALAAIGAIPSDPAAIPDAWGTSVTLRVANGCGDPGGAGELLLVQLSGSCSVEDAASASPQAAGLVVGNDAPGDPETPDGASSRPVLEVSDLWRKELAQAAQAAGGTLTLSVGKVVQPIVSGNGGLVTSFSSRGPAALSLLPKPDLSAPGQDVLSAFPGGYTLLNGTSMAAPAVAGAAAILRQRHPTWSVQDIKSALMLTAKPVYEDTAKTIEAPPTVAGAGLIDVAAADSTPLLTTATPSTSFVLTRDSDVRWNVELRDAGTGAGTWTVDAGRLGGPSSITVPQGGTTRLELTLKDPGGPSRLMQGVVLLHSPTRTLRLIWVALVDHPRITAEPVHAVEPGVITGDLRRGRALISHYRFPDDPRGYGLPRLYPGRELVYSFPVPKGAHNAGAAVVAGRAVPQLLVARDENRLGGETALPLELNPYLDRWGSQEPVTGALLPAERRLYVVVETRPGSKPGRFTLRVWADDRTPPKIDHVTRTVRRGQRVKYRIVDTQSGVSWNDVVVRVDGDPVEAGHSGDVGSFPVAGLDRGRHTISIDAPDLQETKNSENAAAVGRPNTRAFFATFRVTG
jgi:minor extracellular serine protease Vpr